MYTPLNVYSVVFKAEKKIVGLSFRRRTLRELRGDYDTVSDSIIINTKWSDPAMDPDAELPFS